MDLLILLTAQLLPAVFYLTFCFLLLAKDKSEYDIISSRNHNVPRMADVYLFSLLYLLIAVGFIVDCVYSLAVDKVDIPYMQSVSVYRIYIISSFLPCVMLKYLINFYKYGRYIYAGVAVLGIGVIVIGYFPSLDSCFPPEVVLHRIAVGTNVIALSAFLYMSVLRKDESTDVILWKMSRTLRIYVAYYLFLTILFIYYLLTSRHQVDYIITICGFVIIHFLLVYYKNGSEKPSRPAPYPIPDELDTEYIPILEDTEPDAEYRFTYADARVDIDDMKDRIVEYLDKKRMFLHPDLNMEKMANDLCTNKTYLSRVINNDMHKTFRELVNYFRIKEAIRIYNETQEIKIEELSALCGFNNMASFTNAFKVNTGKTPGEWCRDAKKNIKINSYGKGNNE